MYVIMGQCRCAHSLLKINFLNLPLNRFNHLPCLLSPYFHSRFNGGACNKIDICYVLRPSNGGKHLVRTREELQASSVQQSDKFPLAKFIPSLMSIPTWLLLYFIAALLGAIYTPEEQISLLPFLLVPTTITAIDFCRLQFS